MLGGLSALFKKFEGAAKKMMIVSLICTLLYMVAGIIYNLQVKAIGGDEAALAQKAAAKQAREEIAAASAAPYTAPAQPAQPAADAPMSDERRVELLAKYSQLLKDGAITQEEFDEKKKELLSK